MTISIIAAIGNNRELGKNNTLLWDIPEDMKFFRTTTAGHPVIMGRKTFESIGFPLPNRVNIVITRNKNYSTDGVITTFSLEEAITEAKKHHNEIFIIGGSEIYKQALSFTDTLYLTHVFSNFPEADAFFPEYKNFFPQIISEKKSKNEKFEYCFEKRSKIL